MDAGENTAILSFSKADQNLAIEDEYVLNGRLAVAVGPRRESFVPQSRLPAGAQQARLPDDQSLPQWAQSFAWASARSRCLSPIWPYVSSDMAAPRADHPPAE
jgi:hypothetical protein